jgi:hypothetical protein
MFGKEESIREIEDIPLQGPGGEDLYLAYKTSSYFFGAGVYLTDDGYVLGIRGVSDKYFPLAGQDQIAEMQAIGQLPNPMPQYSVSLFDYVFGYSLWVIFGIILIVGLVQKRRSPSHARQAAGHSLNKLRSGVSTRPENATGA